MSTLKDMLAPMPALSVRRLGIRMHWLAVSLALAFYFAATLPHLADFPLMGQDEPWIAASAANLATHGVYGDDLFTGYYGMEQHTYNFPPLFPLAEALAFRLLGVGAWQARLVAVLFGAATLGLTYALGRRLYGGAVGALAAWLLVGLRLALEPRASGVPFIDLARIARYDIAVPPLVLAALLCFVWADSSTTDDRRPTTARVPGGRWRYFAAGALAGLAFLAHVYGGFVLAPIGALMLWRHGWGVLRRPAPYLVAAGFGLAALPWALYIARDLPAYYGQMLPEQGRFQLWDPAFYLDSLLREPSRYSRLLRMDGATALWPRLGIWLALLGLPLSCVLLVGRLIHTSAILLQMKKRRGEEAKTRNSSPPRLFASIRVAISKQNDPRVERTINSKQSAICNLQSAIPIADQLLLLTLPIFALLLALLINLKFYNYIVLLLPFVALNLAYLAALAWQAARWLRRGRIVARLVLGGLLALALLEGMAGVWRSLRSAAAISSYASYTARVAAAIPPGARVLALHQFWFGVYQQGYSYRSMALVFYYSDPRFYQPAPLPMDTALARVAPEYVLVDRSMAPELRMELPIESIADDQRRRFREYMARHCARPVAQIDDPDYGNLTIYRLCP